MKLPKTLNATAGTEQCLFLLNHKIEESRSISPNYVSFFNNLYANSQVTRNNIIAILQGAAGSVGNYANDVNDYALVVTGWHTSNGDNAQHLTVRLYRGYDNSLRRTCHVYANGTTHCN
jgi:hypothetical protein